MGIVVAEHEEACGTLHIRDAGDHLRIEFSVPTKVGQSGSNDDNTEDAMHWRCACKHVHYLDNHHASPDVCWQISFPIRVLRHLPMIGFKIVSCLAIGSQNSLVKGFLR